LALRIKRLQRSRRNLARLALLLRRRVKKNHPAPPALAELEKQAECLRGLQREYQTLLQEYETRLREVERAEREVCDERAAFEGERAEQRVRMEQAERELARRQAELSRAPLAQVASATDDDQVTQQRTKNLDQRSRELHSLARYLQRCRRQLMERTPDASYPHEVEHWRQQCEQLQANWAVLEAQFQQHDTELKAELTRLREEIRITRERTSREGGMRERLGQLRSLKEELIGTAPSAPGSQLRPAVDLMGNPVQE
jgi:DNA repair exonuclease SbcCD ATPase subunit